MEPNAVYEGGKFSLNGSLKKLGVKKQVNKGLKAAEKQVKKEAKQLAKDLKKQAKNGVKKVVRKVAADGAAMAAEAAVRAASTGAKQIPVVGDIYSAADDQFDLEDKMVSAARKGARKETKKQINKRSGGALKGSQEMKDRMAKLRAMRKPKSGGPFRSPSGGSFKSAETDTTDGGSFRSPKSGGAITYTHTASRPSLYMKDRKFARRDVVSEGIMPMRGAGFLQ